MLLKRALIYKSNIVRAIIINKNSINIKTTPLKLVVTLIYAIFLVACSTDNASWIEDNHEYIDNKKITEITMPGTHIANAYNVDKDNPKCTGEILPQSYSSNALIEQELSSILVNSMPHSDDTFNLFIEELNTQDVNIAKQLKTGVRYLDIRICQQDGEFYTANLYLTDKFDTIAEQITQFLATHPQEIIIVDFDNNLRNESGYMDGKTIALFHAYLDKTFGNLIASKDKISNTIGELKQQHYQIILLSSNSELNAYPDIWNKDQITITVDAQSATIKKLSVMEALLSNNTLGIPNKLNIVPIYSDIDIGELTTDINNNTESNNSPDNTINNYTDDETDQSIILNYLGQNIGNHPSIIVTDKDFLPTIEYLIIQQEINATFIESTPTNNNPDQIATESAH